MENEGINGKIWDRTGLGYMVAGTGKLRVCYTILCLCMLKFFPKKIIFRYLNIKLAETTGKSIDWQGFSGHRH